MEDADLVVLQGGSDIDPKMYNEERHITTWSNEWADMEVKEEYEEARDRGLPVVGICKGAQFICIMNGGSLYQDVDNHTTGHDMLDVGTGEVIPVTSTHHQMMREGKDSKGVVIGVANGLATRKLYMEEGDEMDAMDGVNISQSIDPEVIIYPYSLSLAVQFHPEYVDKEHPSSIYFFKLLDQYLLGERELCVD